jgi:hypothetical protein
MIFESTYRRQALNKWESEKQELRKELKEKLGKKRNITKNPLVYAFTYILAWFTQQ